MPKSIVILGLLWVAIRAVAADEPRPCQQIPEAGDPGNAGAGLTVSVRSTSGGGQEGMDVDLTVGAVCQTWSRQAQTCWLVEPVPHVHYYAADQTAYAGDTLRWTEYGPAHSEDEILSICKAPEEGDATVRFATGAPCEDYYGVLLTVVNVAENEAP